ncbi:hypothetical protein WBW50_22480, partial [Escherichia marmotae]|uniref:hypothetical protein n=1 Tax=Escherichia marmotae TaxID=1499973 RepID=UPI003D17ADE1
MPDAMLAHLIRPTIGAGSVGRIRRSRRIRQLAHDTCCDAGASYQAYNWCRIGRPDKAFPPHPAIGAR